MLSALELVFAGGIYMPREILALESSSVRKVGEARGATDGTARPKPADLGLTTRQLDLNQPRHACPTAMRTS